MGMTLGIGLGVNRGNRGGAAATTAPALVWGTPRLEWGASILRWGS